MSEQAEADPDLLTLPGERQQPFADPADARADPDADVAARVGTLGHSALRAEFERQGAFLHVGEFLPDEVTEGLVASAQALQDRINRNYLPGHKQGGSVSRHTIDQHAPFIAQLYRS